MQWNTVVTVDGGKDVAGVGCGTRNDGWSDSNGNVSIIHKSDSSTLIKLYLKKESFIKNENPFSG